MKRRSFTIAGLITLAGISVARAEPDLLPPDQAFKMALGSIGHSTIEVKFRSANGYYLYADRFVFESDTSVITVVGIAIPAGQTKYEEAFGRDVTYLRGDVSVSVRVQGPAIPFKLVVRAQGCADAGMCYPPVVRTFDVSRRNS
jgi:thiol:disulfide interchange protein DsbD